MFAIANIRNQMLVPTTGHRPVVCSLRSGHECLMLCMTPVCPYHHHRCQQTSSYSPTGEFKSQTVTFRKHVEATETHRMLRGRLGLGFAHRQTQVAKLASTCLSDPSLHGIVLWLGRRCSYYVQSRSTRSKRSPQAGRYEAHSKISFRLIAKISRAVVPEFS